MQVLKSVKIAFILPFFFLNKLMIGCYAALNNIVNECQILPFLNYKFYDYESEILKLGEAVLLLLIQNWW